MRYLILHNVHDRDSREFVRLHGHEADVLNWLEDEEGRAAYLQGGKPHPSGFPAVHDTQTNFTTGIVLSFEQAVKILDEMATPVEEVYKVRRRQAYYDQGLNSDAWSRAWIQAQEDNDTSELDRLRQIRSEIKLKYPKPPQE